MNFTMLSAGLTSFNDPTRLATPNFTCSGSNGGKKGVSAALMAQHGLPHPTLLAVGAMEEKRGSSEALQRYFTMQQRGREKKGGPVGISSFNGPTRLATPVLSQLSLYSYWLNFASSSPIGQDYTASFLIGQPSFLYQHDFCAGQLETSTWCIKKCFIKNYLLL